MFKIQFLYTKHFFFQKSFQDSISQRTAFNEHAFRTQLTPWLPAAMLKADSYHLSLPISTIVESNNASFCRSLSKLYEPDLATNLVALLAPTTMEVTKSYIALMHTCHHMCNMHKYLKSKETANPLTFSLKRPVATPLSLLSFLRFSSSGSLSAVTEREAVDVPKMASSWAAFSCSSLLFYILTHQLC